ncbi:endoglucanase [Colletotrichum musicola]|uniref:Endoglucanase n=1 Tax=Colletotrichum musicola TaxID=2175873 RepID=A0A8H6JIZ9_9PEZI|nr:endoglucanase [Colletotrichum musicola]
MSPRQFSLVAAAMLASVATAHVVLENPRPFKSVADGPSNPISSTGDDFPCKVPAGASYIIDGERTVYAVNEPQVATFKGQAVHGGGSCQFALSADLEPTKESRWMVIHSIEGGCPARNQKGNLEGPNQDEYSFVIPEGIAPGDYTFAWTWQARVGGQPEYYMNCAPITVVGAKKKLRCDGGGAVESRRHQYRESLAKRAEFPELFMANMGDVSGGCTTSEALTAQIPIKYPHAGDSVDHPEGNANLFAQPCDGNPRAGAGGAAPPPGGGAEGPASSAPAGEPGAAPPTSSAAGESPVPTTTSVPQEQPVATSPAQPPVATQPPVPSAPVASCPVPAISTIEVTVTVTATVTADAPAASQPPAAPSGYPAAPSVPVSAPGSCTEGKLTCLPGEVTFATCTGGKLTAPQPIAPGFKCRAGEGDGLDISPAAIA